MLSRSNVNEVCHTPSYLGVQSLDLLTVGRGFRTWLAYGRGV